MMGTTKTRDRSGSDGIAITDIISFSLYILMQYYNTTQNITGQYSVASLFD